MLCVFDCVPDCRCVDRTLLNTDPVGKDPKPVQNECTCPACPKCTEAQDSKCPKCAESANVLVEKVDPDAVSETYKKLVDGFYGGENPWDGYSSTMEADHSYPHTSVKPQFLTKLFEVAQPEFIAEFGSFKGGSAIIMASVLKELGMAKKCAILCVDPFTGDVNMWTDMNHWRDPFLMLDHGHPRVAEQSTLR